MVETKRRDLMDEKKMTDEALEDWTERLEAMKNSLKEMMDSPPKYDPTINTRDPKEWGDGPWQNEPDRLEFKSHGFDCLIQRVEWSGHLCGYVAVPEGHPYFGKNYNDVPAEAHGGLTYSEHCNGHICHKADEGSPEVWWLGFDCAHGGDLIPSSRALDRAMGWRPGFRSTYDTYKTIEYVKRHVEQLAEQLSLAGKANAAS
jgi:hypothetical protein